MLPQYNLCTGGALGPERVARQVGAQFGLELSGIRLTHEVTEPSRPRISSLTPIIDYEAVVSKYMSNISCSDGVIIFRRMDMSDLLVDYLISFCFTGRWGTIPRHRHYSYRPCLIISEAIKEGASQNDIHVDSQRFAEFVISGKMKKINITGSTFSFHPTIAMDPTATTLTYSGCAVEQFDASYDARIYEYLRTAFSFLTSHVMMREPLTSSWTPAPLERCKCTPSLPPLYSSAPSAFTRRTYRVIPFSLYHPKHKAPLEDDVFSEDENHPNIFDPDDYLNFSLD